MLFCGFLKYNNRWYPEKFAVSTSEFINTIKSLFQQCKPVTMHKHIWSVVYNNTWYHFQCFMNIFVKNWDLCTKRKLLISEKNYHITPVKNHFWCLVSEILPDVTLNSWTLCCKSLLTDVPKPSFMRHWTKNAWSNKFLHLVNDFTST